MPLIENRKCEVLVIGAGMAGLTAARRLQNAGKGVRLLDKGRGVGGRMATRRIGDYTFDHGAQFITTRSPWFSGEMRSWEQSGVAQSWCQGFAATADGHTRWRGAPAMNAIPKHLAEGLVIDLQTKVVALNHDGQQWQVTTDRGALISASSLILTAPVPQSLELIDSGNLRLEPSVRAALAGIEYERCFAVMASLDEPSRVPEPGGFAPPDGPVAWIADNQKKGISARPGVTIHATHDFSLSHWDLEREQIGFKLILAVGPLLGQMPKSFEVHGWKYSKPKTVFAEPCVVAHQKPLLVLAGDAFSGPKVEGAAVSGWHAAATVLDQTL